MNNRKPFYKYFIEKSDNYHDYYFAFTREKDSYIITNTDIDYSTIDFKTIVIHDIDGNINISRRRKREVNLQYPLVELKDIYASIRSNFKFTYLIKYELKYIDEKQYNLLIYQNDFKKIEKWILGKDKEYNINEILEFADLRNNYELKEYCKKLIKDNNLEFRNIF